jgi:dolichyl-phosphate-mannose--protein O-mannosyl transferase
LDIRPILYYLEYFSDGTRSSFGAFVNPFLCWGGLLALFVLCYLAIARKDAKAKFIIIGYLAQLLPWVLVSRLTFEYHYFPCTVFLVLALGYIFSIFEKNVKRYKLYVYGFAVGCVGLFVLFYPALSGAVVNNTMASKLLGWLPTWPF